MNCSSFFVKSWRRTRSWWKSNSCGNLMPSCCPTCHSYAAFDELDIVSIQRTHLRYIVSARSPVGQEQLFKRPFWHDIVSTVWSAFTIELMKIQLLSLSESIKSISVIDWIRQHCRISHHVEMLILRRFDTENDKIIEAYSYQCQYQSSIKETDQWDIFLLDSVVRTEFIVCNWILVRTTEQLRANTSRDLTRSTSWWTRRLSPLSKKHYVGIRLQLNFYYVSGKKKETDTRELNDVSSILSRELQMSPSQKPSVLASRIQSSVDTRISTVEVDMTSRTDATRTASTSNIGAALY